MKKIYLFFFGLLLCLLGNVAVAQQMFMKAGTFTTKGSTSDRFEDYVEITSLQFGITAPSSQTGPGGGTAGRPDFKNIVITKNVDISSVKFLQTIATGKRIPLIEIVNTFSREGRPEVIYKVELKDVLVTEIASSSVPGCSSGCPAVAESYSFSFVAIRITTYTIDPTGKVTADPPFSFNVQKQTADF